MKEFKFPMNIPTLRIFVGLKEWEGYKTFADVDEEEAPGKGEGRTTANTIWVEELEWEILFHEICHYLDFVYFIKDIPTELEYRADIAGMVNSTVVQWVMKEMGF